jgi:ribosomal protein L29
MAVQVATLDILTERAHFEPEVARAIGDAITMEINHAKDALATRSELFEVRDDLKQELSEFRSEVKAEFASVRADTQAEFASVRGEIATLRVETEAEFVSVRQEIAEVRKEMKTEFALVRAEIKVATLDSKTDMMKFMWYALTSQSALIIGVMYFMLTHLR